MLLTIREVAAGLHVSTMTVRRWWYAGILPQPIKIRGALRWRAEDVDSWLAHRDSWTADDARKENQNVEA